ncbi:hemerythrin domain-containing protein [Histidinibacterium aquaticum]|uniref:Hemerythrin domain-containing protein n=1 Tax=Histidinibacterium aquaticum TaxID=2613962 RepID=A0A5J5GSR1_9RHOB|nr:hemerythrin domain-containing protein [Histidinibacterium aquaticum]KAA9010412.1 hemerythrin domain-containing protein [Histidinibacterium aquaticum]
MDMTGLALEERDGLPDPLRVLVKEYPREGWAAHENFASMVKFWLDRHMMFRKLMGMMREETEALLDARIAPEVYGQKLSRMGGMFVQELHGHHQIEDIHYFPVLQRQDDRVARGFEILDHDHHSIDGHLNAFVENANGALKVLDNGDRLKDGAGRFHSGLETLEGFLNRHLIDEEELVVPVILKYGADALPH